MYPCNGTLHIKDTAVRKPKSAYVQLVSKNVFITFRNIAVLLIRLQLGLPTFCTVRHNGEWSFLKCKEQC